MTPLEYVVCMGYSDITDPQSVELAIAEFDASSSPEIFLEKYGYKPSTSYLLRFKGKSYPPKAILGVAHGYQFPELGPLKNTEFSGGENSTNKVLLELGFEVVDAGKSIRFLNAIRSVRGTSLSGGQKAPHKALLLLLAIKHASLSPTRLMPIKFWASELQKLFDEYASGIAQSVDQPIWRLETSIWVLGLDGIEQRPNPVGEPITSVLRNERITSGLTEDAFEALQEWETRVQAVELIVSNMLLDFSDQQKERLRNMTLSSTTWWVNQGKTYAEERDGQIVWAPVLQKNQIAAGHHSALAQMKTGDVVIHYSKGAVRAIGQVIAEAIGKPNPFVRKDNEWEIDGREVGVRYFELDTAISLTEISDLPIGQGPFNRNGGVNQGYMFELPEVWVPSLRTQFASRWPSGSPWGTSPQSFGGSNRLQELATWLIEFRQVQDFDAQEIDYKIEICARVNDSLELMKAREQNWLENLRQSLTSKNNLVSFRTVRGVLNQMLENPIQAEEVLLQLLDESVPLAIRIDTFADWDTINSGSGVKLSLISLLLASSAPQDLPIFTATPVSAIHRLIGRRASKELASVRYRQFIDLIDELLALCHGLLTPEQKPISNRLEMQSSMWMIKSAKPHESWSIAKQRDFLAFIGGEIMSNHLEDLSDEVLLDVSFLNEIEELLEDKKQVIFYGPPGAGKTYIAMKLAEALSEGSEELNPVELVQFHPSYAYEDFVEGFRPSEEGTFKLHRGKLLSIADRAKKNPETKFFLIIDEINRGNVAKIFGEMYFLLEYRDNAIQLQYSDEPFKMPKNLYFIGTMNSADRSIGLIDSALRRRFHFVSFYPTEDEMKDLLRNWLKQNAPDVVWIADAVDEINSKIDRNFAIGPSHFMKSNLDDSLARKVWKRSILPYIEDVFFNQQSKVDEFRLENLRTLKRLNQDKLAAENELEEDDSAAEAS